MSLVMECMEGGELFSRVMDREVFPERDAAHTAWQMLLALNYIHSHGIVHRDIKLENFMYARKDTDHLKLIDFGLSKVWEPNTKMEASCGTLGYIAPEVLNKTYSSKCDLWSLGVIVYILLSGCMPFAGSEQHQIVCIMSGMYDMEDEEWTPVSAAAKDFVRKLLVVDPAKRMSADEALAHEWIKDRERIPSESCRVDRSVVDALRKFGEASKFRRACMSLMAWSLTHEERKSVVDAFLELDTSRRGTIRLHEMRDVLSHFDITDQEVAGIFHALDSSHCDEVHYSEFLAAMVSSRIAMHDQLLRSAFARFDVDGRGFISRESLQKLLGDSFEGAPVEELLAEVDPEQQGRVSYEQFVSYLRSGSVQEDHMHVVNSVIDGELKRTGGPVQDAMGSPPKPMKRRRCKTTAETPP
ncbi:CPK3 [Symbiodinium microadriaticum]|nr:CPK3 [Symbiodinium microadriaticum]CAE7881642.1 CPK3 [Symbiodinium sp. KB8]